MKKYKTYLLFAGIFVLLSMMTLITALNIEDNISLATMAYAQPVYSNNINWGDKYLPYTNTELDELKSRIVLDVAQDGHVFLVTRKTGVFNSLWAPKNWSVIWTPDCVEMKKLISSHKLSFETYTVNGNNYYLVLDEGRMYGKSKELVEYELGKEPLVDRFGEINKCKKSSSSSSSRKGTGIIVIPSY